MSFIIFLAGLLVIVVGYLFHKKRKDLKSVCTMKVVGEVVRMDCREEVEVDTDSDGHETESTKVTYYPVYRYIADGRSIEKTSSAGSSHPKFNEGQSVTVMYDPANPEQYYVVEDKSADRFGIYFMAFGAVVFIIGIISLFVTMGG